MFNPIVHCKKLSESVEIFGDRISFITAAQRAENDISVMEVEVAPGAQIPMHRHIQQDESYYMIAGDLEFTVANEPLATSPGVYLTIPKGTAHRYRNNTSTPARFLLCVTPGGMENFFRELAVLLHQSAPAMEQLPGLAARHGIELL